MLTFKFPHSLLAILISGLSLVLCSCTKIEAPEEEPAVAFHVNICVLGNSYSNDSFSYVPFILRQYGITSNIHIYYRSGGSLYDLDKEWNGGKDDVSHYHIDTRTDKKWQRSQGIPAKEIVSSEHWDIVSFQQSSLQVDKENSYFPYLDNIIDRVRELCPYQLDLAWFMAYNRANNDANEENLRVQHTIVDKMSFGLVFPVATAVFNCQANPVLSGMGDSEYGRMYSADNVHLQEGLPCYVAALSIVEAILRKYSPDKTVLGDKVRPVQKWIEEIGGITPNGGAVGVTEDNCLLAQRAAVSANDHLFEIVPAEL